MEEYTVGSLGDLISGQKTDGKVKVIKKEFQMIQKNSKEIPNSKQKQFTKKKDKKNKQAEFNRKEEKINEKLNGEDKINGNVKVLNKKKKNKNKTNNKHIIPEHNEVKESVQVSKKKNNKNITNDQSIVEQGKCDEYVGKDKQSKKLKRKKTEPDVTLDLDSLSNDEEEKPKKIRLEDVDDSKDIDIEDLELPEVNDDSSDDETEVPKKKKTKLSNAEMRIKSKENKGEAKIKEEAKKQFDLQEDRTIFIGNVDVQCSKKSLKSKFGKYGKIEAIRFRNAPIADIRTPKKVAIIKKEFHPNVDILNAFIRFEKREDALKSLAHNGKIINGKHIRVDMCDSKKSYDGKRAIFLGNLDFKANDEDLWKLFEPCGPIESIRIIKDNKTNIGKGFAYINFVSADSVQLALDMGEVSLNNRVIRVSICNNRPKNKYKTRIEGPKKPRHPKHKKFDRYNDDDDDRVKGADFQGSKLSEKKKKRKVDKGALQRKKMVKLIAPKT